MIAWERDYCPAGQPSYNASGMPILDEHSLDFWSHSPEQTTRFGGRLGEMLLPGDVITISGDLGAGKTTLVGGIGRGWGSADQVTSPTIGRPPPSLQVSQLVDQAGDGMRLYPHIARRSSSSRAPSSGIG